MTYAANNQLRHQRQRGMASIVITLVTMLVIALIVLGFAAISRREQRQALDQQLSAQAFYAAESGVEDAKTAIQSAIGSGQQPVGKSKCDANDPGGNYPTPQNGQNILDVDTKVSYSCLKVNMAPKDVVYDGVGEDSIVVPVKSEQAYDRIELTWKPTTSPPGTPAACPASATNSFTPQPDWPCGYGALRVDAVATDAPMAFDAYDVYQHTSTSWFVPTRNATPTSQSAFNTILNRPTGDRQDVLAASCDTVAYTQCKASITDLGGHRQFYLRVSSLYKQSNLTVVAYQGAKPVAFTGTQVVIDSTGKAQDVLRRIQVRLPLGPNPGMPPNFAIQTNSSICKRFTAGPGVFSIPNDIVDPDAGNPMCQQKTDIPTDCTPNHDVVLVLDHSGSMNDNLQGSNISTITQLRNIVKRFITNTNIAPNTNHVGIIEFDDNAKLGIGLTSDQQALLNYTATVNADGGTVYLKALNAADAELHSSRARPGSPKTVIFISDGAPEDPTGPILTKTTAMKDAGISIYTIGLNNSANINLPGWLGGGNLGFNEQLLKDMAGNGGRYFLANTDADAQAGLDGISIDLKCEGATPTPPPPPPPASCTPANDVALVLDHSGSMDNNLQGSNITTIAQLKNIVRNFINTTNIAPTTNHVAIVKFAATAVLGIGLTSDQQALINYINSTTLSHDTNYIPGLNIATGELNGARGRPGIPKVVIFISDGSPDDSPTQIRTLTTNMKNAGIRIYTIGLDNGSGFDEPLLIDMAGNGGRYFRANTDAEAQAGLDGISIDLKCTPSASKVKSNVFGQGTTRR